MSLDAITINALCGELSKTLADARIDKVRMPRHDEVVFAMRGTNGSFKLAVSCSGTGAKVYITDEKADNPESPPMFCMLLRKHMIAARLLEISQPDYERMILMRFSAYDDFGEISEKSIVIEMTGRNNNIILLSADNIILGCLKKVDEEMSPLRPVLPGLRYHMPPRAEKTSLTLATSAQIADIAAKALHDQSEASKSLTASFDILSPAVAQELVFRANGRVDVLEHELATLAQTVREQIYAPTMMSIDGAYRDFTFMEMSHFGTNSYCTKMESFSALICEFYAQKTAAERQKNAAGSLVKLMKTVEGRLVKKLVNQKNDLLDAQKREELKKTADLITANIHSIPRDAAEATVTDYFSPGLPQITIKLDDDLSPQKNAQKLYSQYTKMKNAEEAMHAQIENGERVLEYVQSVLMSLADVADEKDVLAIREELLESGYVRNREKHARKKAVAFRPHEFLSPSGMRVLCGRNNRENDELTLKTASKNDVWFHSHLAPGSHVILFTGGAEPTEQDLEYAAALAAGHSKLSEQNLAAIDYALVRHVKKPSGAKPGMVIYTNYKTLFVAPNKENN